MTTQITSPITAITNSITKAMFTPLLSSELSSLESPLDPIKNNNIVRIMYDYVANVRLWEVVAVAGAYYHIETKFTSVITNTHI